ncbi:DUF4349 domain-containing protein [Flavobacterium sp.]|uniref:DUF4349 domain-containing protein n=1 Tax=Flavobacterium sp. TaxID=239 RepID=UPI0028BE8C7B|nr:DUF4349 domain-containing protein [Flavobacterium sp.]
MKILVALFSLFVIPLACNSKAEDSQAVTETTEAYAPAMKAEANYEMVDSAAAAVEEGESEAKIESKIIKTGSLRFETENLNETFATIQKSVSKHKGIIQNDNSGKDYNSSYRNLTIRIPSSSFDAVIADISQGVKHFDRKEISAQDVTEEYVDLEARVKAKKVLEERYLELLKKANKVSEMLEIERELSNIREEIEAKEGRMKYLQHQVSMSTIHLEMYTNNPSESGATVSYFGKMWNAIQDGFNNIATFFLGLLHIWPFILIFVVLIVFIRRKLKKKTA